MRVTVPARERGRLVRALHMERRQDGNLDLTLLRLDPSQHGAVVAQTLGANDRGIDALANGAPVFDTRGIVGFPEGFWPARRTAGGWIALIDEPATPSRSLSPRASAQ